MSFVDITNCNQFETSWFCIDKVKEKEHIYLNDLDPGCFIKEYCAQRGMLLATLKTKEQNEFATGMVFDAFERKSTH